MSFYFLNESIRGEKRERYPLKESPDLPVSVKKDTWQHLENPRRIAKNYLFTDPNQQTYFVNEVMKTVDITRHHVKISIERNGVQIETRTETVDDITEIDLEISRNVDEIFNDSMYILVI